MSLATSVAVHGFHRPLSSVLLRFERTTLENPGQVRLSGKIHSNPEAPRRHACHGQNQPWKTWNTSATYREPSLGQRRFRHQNSIPPEVCQQRLRSSASEGHPGSRLKADSKTMVYKAVVVRTLLNASEAWTLYRHHLRTPGKFPPALSSNHL